MNTINFIPRAFEGEADNCPVCVARVKLEEILAIEKEQLIAISELINTTGTSNENEAKALAQVWSTFARMIGDYRVAFAINLSIWFSAEIVGRIKKVPNLLSAYEDYRLQSLNSFEQFDASCLILLSLLSKRKDAAETLLGAVSKLAQTHKILMETNSDFWTATDAWTNPRREEAFRVL